MSPPAGCSGWQLGSPGRFASAPPPAGPPRRGVWGREGAGGGGRWWFFRPPPRRPRHERPVTVVIDGAAFASYEVKAVHEPEAREIRRAPEGAVVGVSNARVEHR